MLLWINGPFGGGRTHDLSVPQVAESVARSAGLRLNPDTGGMVRRLRHARVTLKHVHFGRGPG